MYILVLMTTMMLNYNSQVTEINNICIMQRMRSSYIQYHIGLQINSM